MAVIKIFSNVQILLTESGLIIFISLLHESAG